MAAAGTAVVGIPYALVALSAGSILGDHDPARTARCCSRCWRSCAPTALTILVLSAIIAASCSTANGVVLGTASVAVRNIAGIEPAPQDDWCPIPCCDWSGSPWCRWSGDRDLIRAGRAADRVLLTLAFDLMLAALVVPFVLGALLVAERPAAAAPATVSGVGPARMLFALTPTMYGVPNAVLLVPNEVF